MSLCKKPLSHHYLVGRIGRKSRLSAETIAYRDSLWERYLRPLLLQMSLLNEGCVRLGWAGLGFATAANLSLELDSDASVTRNMVALLGDMADTMDGIGELFREKTFYQALFQELHSDDNFDSTLNWARERIAQRLTQ